MSIQPCLYKNKTEKAFSLQGGDELLMVTMVLKMTLTINLTRIWQESGENLARIWGESGESLARVWQKTDNQNGDQRSTTGDKQKQTKKSRV